MGSAAARSSRAVLGAGTVAPVLRFARRVILQCSQELRRQRGGGVYELLPGQGSHPVPDPDEFVVCLGAEDSEVVQQIGDRLGGLIREKVIPVLQVGVSSGPLQRV